MNKPFSELLDLEGKGAVITGGAMGLGLAITTRLAEAGASVFIMDSNASEAEAACAALSQSGFTAYSAPCDVSSEEQVRKSLTLAEQKMGGVDILVNSAGIYPRMPLETMTAADFGKVLGINLTGTFLCCSHASRIMKERKRGGCIINIASIEALHPSSTGMAAYDASKGGVLTLTKSLARELGKHDIRVNVIAPGAIITRGVYSQVGQGDSPEEQKEQLKQLKTFMSRMALGRMGEPDDIARAALFLASDMSAYITGSLLVVDGGYLIS